MRTINRLEGTHSVPCLASIIMTVTGKPELFGLPAFGFPGYTFATIGGVWLLLYIWKMWAIIVINTHKLKSLGSV